MENNNDIMFNEEELQREIELFYTPPEAFNFKEFLKKYPPSKPDPSIPEAGPLGFLNNLQGDLNA